MGEYMVGPIDGELGPMFMLTAPPLVKQDFFQAYAQPTFWPYCESLERCVVYRCGRLPHAEAVPWWHLPHHARTKRSSRRQFQAARSHDKQLLLCARTHCSVQACCPCRRARAWSGGVISAAVHDAWVCMCIACSQNQSAAALVPVEITLPPGVGAIDFYLDLAIDCVNTTSVTMPCFVMVEPLQPDPFVIIKPVSSICASAKVGQYFGFYHHAGAFRTA